MSRPRVKGVLSLLIAALALVAVVPAAASAAGSISGTVKDFDTGTGVAGVEVCAENQFTSDEPCTASGTGADGKYKLDLPEGTYEVAFYPEAGVGYLPQWYNEQDLRPFDPDLIEVEAAEITGINARLKRAGTIKGRVTDAVSHSGIAGATVCVNPNGSGIDRCFEAGPDGKYTSPALTPGEYTVAFEDEAGGYPRSYYDQKTNPAEAKKVTVIKGGTLEDIDAALSKGSSIAGTVTEAGSGAQLEAIDVCLYDSGTGENVGECKSTNSFGTYKFSALQVGLYKIGFSEEPDPIFKDAYDTQFYADKATFGEALSIQLAAPEDRTGIDAHLHKTGSGGTENPPPAGGGGSGGGGGGSTETLPGPTTPKLLKCKKGFKKKTVKGKARCVKKKKAKKKKH